MILQRWKGIFAWIPVETLVYENQDEYYQVLQESDNLGNSAKFVEFMLEMICNALKEISDTTNVVINVITNEDKILALLRLDGHMSASMLSESAGITYGRHSGFWRN